MKVLYSTILLAAGGLEGTNGARWNGSQVNDEAAFFRAAALGYFPRGNRGTTFSFAVTKQFDTEALAMYFAAMHQASVPTQGDLHVLDESGATAVLLASAVLDTIALGPLVGCSLVVQYTFKGGVFTSEDTPPDSDPVEADAVKRGSVDLAANDESKAVTFDTAFGSAPPVVNCWVVPLTTSSVQLIQAVPQSDTITASGFTAKIGFPIPESGYKLFWEAYAP